MKILFCGTPKFASNIAQSLHQKHELVALITQPDKPFGRKKELKIPEVKEYGLDNSIEVFQPDSITLEFLERFEFDVLVVVAYGVIFPKEVVERFRCINVHASILPKFRGASPIQEMILEGRREFGVSVMRMESGLDSGDILGIGFVDPNKDMSLCELTEEMSFLGSRVLLDVLDRIEIIKPLKQRDCESSLCKKVLKTDGLVDFCNAREIYLKYLAYGVWPSIFTSSGLKLFDVALSSEGTKHNAGEILEIRKDAVVVGCESGSISIGFVQPQSKSKISAFDFVNGRRMSVGDFVV